jgi:hypothetical protein
MKLFALLGAVVVVGMPAATIGATPDAEVMMPVRAFIDGFNKGDTKAAAAQTSPDGIVIVDDIAPFTWIGPKAFDTWGEALDNADKVAGNTDDHVTYGKPVHVEVGVDRAYVVLPVVYTFKQKGVAQKETAHMALTLQKGNTGWLITGFSWAGTKAKPAEAGAK